VNWLARYFVGLVVALQTVIVAGLTLSNDPVADKRPLVRDIQSAEQLQAALSGMSKEQLSALYDKEREAFLQEPLDRRALQNLAILEELRGNVNGANMLSTLLANYGRRSVGAQLPAIRNSLVAQNFVDAWQRIDGILRANPELSDKIFPLIAAHMPNKIAQSELVKVLGAEPPWREAFFLYLSKASNTAGYAYSLLNLLRKQGVQPLDSEVRSLIASYIQAKNYDAAYFAWLDLLPETDLRRARNVFDAKFETEPRNLFFDWNMPIRKNARHELLSRPGKATDLFLAMDFYNDTQGGHYIFQYTRLLPGTYDMTIDFQTEQLISSTGLVWRIGCIGHSQKLAETSPMSGTVVWETLRVSFEVPQQDCATQNLSLENRSPAKLDQKLTGRILLDNISIVETSR
jgi:hypothetical protein